MINVGKNRIARHRYWIAHNRFLSSLEKKAEKEIKNVLFSQYENFISLYSSGIEDYSSINKFNLRLKNALLNSMIRVVVSSFELSKNEIEKFENENFKYFITYEKKGVSESLIKTIINAISIHVAEKVVKINNTTKNNLKTWIKESIIEGLTIAETIRKLKNNADNFSKVRSKRIVRTELHSTMEKTQHETMQRWGVAKNKDWLTSIDGRERKSHNLADGQTVPVDEPFVVDGENLMFPGDPSGSAKNIIECRCTAIYET